MPTIRSRVFVLTLLLTIILFVLTAVFLNLSPQASESVIPGPYPTSTIPPRATPRSPCYAELFSLNLAEDSLASAERHLAELEAQLKAEMAKPEDMQNQQEIIRLRNEIVTWKQIVAARKGDRDRASRAYHRCADPLV